MLPRALKPSRSSSFFLIGQRGTGKSTFLRRAYSADEAVWIDLLDTDTEGRLARRPMALADQLEAVRVSDPARRWVVIDEVQKVPSLLDVVHREIERGHFLFALTGSSARRLRRGGTNLLAGRAFSYAMFPLTHRELAGALTLEETLRFGSLPRLLHLTAEADRIEFLRAYAATYLKEEIVAEQVVRKIPPFRAFLEVAAQSSGKVVNYSAIARDVGSDPVTVKSYFDVLVDTLIGFTLEPWHESVRVRQRTAPKFYIADLGVRAALARRLEQPVTPRTYAFGDAFEHLVIAETIRLASYARRDWTFAYLRTKDDAEIDLIIDRPGLPRACIEIKSTDVVDPLAANKLARIARDIPNSEHFLLSLDPVPQVIAGVRCLHWTDGLAALGI
ncbi:MAG: ATP-binding protein [Myxococcales bacterium]|nr:ATP-binding protein [Myxococcales bacterium]